MNSGTCQLQKRHGVANATPSTFFHTGRAYAPRLAGSNLWARCGTTLKSAVKSEIKPEKMPQVGQRKRLQIGNKAKRNAHRLAQEKVGIEKIKQISRVSDDILPWLRKNPLLKAHLHNIYMREALICCAKEKLTMVLKKEKHPNRVICPRCGKPGTKQSRVFNYKESSYTYWYVAHRIGKKVVKCYIGKKWPEPSLEEADHPAKLKENVSESTVAVWLSKGLIDKIDGLVKRGLYPNRDEAFMFAVHDLLKREGESCE